MILGLDWHAWLTLALLLAMFITMMRTKLPADIIFLGITGLLVITGCISSQDALSGFSSQTVAVVGILFVVVAGLEHTGLLQWTVKNLLGTPRFFSQAIIRLMLPVAALSALLSNTTVVALFINVVKIWSRKLGIAPSKLLIPLSYAAGMGGACTLIGTPPNLLISGFYSDYSKEQLSIFTTTLPGLFCLGIGILSIIMMQKLLPVRKSPEEKLTDGFNGAVEYLNVPADSHLPGQTLGDLGLVEDCRRLKLLGLVHYDGEVEHFCQMSDDMAKDVFLMGGDTLLFTGDRTEVRKLGDRHGMKYNQVNDDTETRTGIPTLISSIIMIAMVMLSSFNVIPLLESCIIAAMLMLILRCCTIKQAKDAVNWDVLMVFACSVTLGKAIDSTGLAQLMAGQMGDICGSNAVMALIIICLLATILTQFISNTACGAIMAPIAIKIATSLDVNPLTFCVALMICVSSSFATPIGSPTHLMVFVPGGYRFSDFVRLGVPMTFIVLAANILICLLLFPL